MQVVITNEKILFRFIDIHVRKKLKYSGTSLAVGSEYTDLIEYVQSAWLEGIKGQKVFSDARREGILRCQKQD